MINCYIAGKYYYGISVMNGKQEGAGTWSPEAYICFVGNKGRTGKMDLQHLSVFKKIKANHWVNFVVESSGNLGEILVVILGLGNYGGFPTSWFVNEVGIYNIQSKNQNAFPCYFWIGHGGFVSCTAKTSKLNFAINKHTLQHALP